MKKKIIATFIVFICFLVLLVGCGKKGYRTIEVIKVEGTVNVTRGKKTEAATVNKKLKSNDVVEVLQSSSTVIKLDNAKYVMVKENTTLRLVATGKKDNTKTKILVDKGGVIVEIKESEKLKEKESFEIASSNSVMAIHGTQISFDVEVKDNKITTSFAVLEGNTKVILLKNEKLSETTLGENFRMSYTTDLSEVKTAKDIAKLIDKAKPNTIETISDAILEETFNAIKLELTTEEIDEIVDSINDFERSAEEKVNKTIKFKFSSNPQYKKDPSEFMTIDEDYKDLVGLQYLYSKTIDGEYKEYSKLDAPLELGEWYCMLKAGNAYRSDPVQFNVVALEFDSPVILSNLYYGGMVYMNGVIENEELIEFFKSDLAKTPIDPNEDSEVYTEYKYYIIAYYVGDTGSPVEYMYPIVFDYDNKGGYGFAAESAVDKMDIRISYSLPEEYTIVSETDYLYDLEGYLKVDNVFATYDESIGEVQINANIEYYATQFGTSDNPIQLVRDEGGIQYEPIAVDVEDGFVSVSINFLQGSFYFMIDGTDVKSELYTIDYSNFTTPTGVSISQINSTNEIITHNENGTINLYCDIGFDGLNQYEYLTVYQYDELLIKDNNDVKITRNKFATGTSSYLIMEDLYNASYSPKYAGVIKEVDGIKYVCQEATQIGTINDKESFYYGYCQPTDNFTVTSYDYFVIGSDIKVYTEDGRLLATVTEDDFITDYSFSKTFAADGYYETPYITGTVYQKITASVGGEHAMDGIITDLALEDIRTVLEIAGITIKGSNKYVAERVPFISG